MSPSGVGAVTVVNDPSTSTMQFVSDPSSFFDLTEKNVYTPITFPTPGSGLSHPVQLPQAGILAMLRIMFVGTLTTTLGGGTVTSRSRWPYGLLDRFVLSANAQNDVWNISGVGMEAHRRLRIAKGAGVNGLDTWPGTTPLVTGAGQVIPNGASTMVLTYEAPIAIDPTTLIGSIYAQSAAMNLQASFREAVTSELLAAAGGATIDSLTGQWFIEVVSFDVPIVEGQDGSQLVVPDVSRLHVVQEGETAFANTGLVPANLVRGNGQLDRLIVAVSGSDINTGTTDAYLDVSQATAAASRIDAMRIEYGNSQRPLDYDPAAFLGQENVDNYGETLPYGYTAFDFLATNPPRDIINMGGVTNLRVVPNVNAAVVLAAGARVYTIQEMLIG